MKLVHGEQREKETNEKEEELEREMTYDSERRKKARYEVIDESKELWEMKEKREI